jgi:cytochrome P450 enzyme
MDLVADFTAKYPLLAITRLLGIPRRLQDDFIQFGSAVIDAFYPAISPEALREKLDFLPRGVSMLERIMEERRASPSSDFFSRIIHAEDQGERLTPKEVISMVALMISAGCEPPRHLISFAMYNLLRHPDQLQLLRSEPDLLRNAIDEAGRFDSFGKLNLPRFALEDVEIRGVLRKDSRYSVYSRAHSGTLTHSRNRTSSTFAGTRAGACSTAMDCTSAWARGSRRTWRKPPWGRSLAGFPK